MRGCVCCSGTGRTFATPRGRWILGLLLLFAVIAIWIASSNVIQFIFREQSFNKPYFLTYYSTSLFFVYLFGFAIFPEWRGQRPWAPEAPVVSTESEKRDDVPTTQDRLVALDSDHEEELGGDEREEGEKDVRLEEGIPLVGSIEVSTPSHWTWRRTALVALGFCPLWFVANYTFNSSLNYTSVSSSTVISSSSSLFTLVLGVLFRIERFTVGKLVATFFCIGGVALVVLADDTGGAGTKPLLGDIFALVGAAGYGAYATYMKFRIPNEKLVSMPMFFGFTGIFNVLLFWPGFLALHYSGVEPFELPPAMVLVALSLNGLIGTVLSDMLWSLVLFLTSALVATMGLSLLIPLAIVVDIVRGNFQKFSLSFFSGSALILLGFTLLNVTSYKKERKLWSSVRQRLCGSPSPVST